MSELPPLFADLPDGSCRRIDVPKDSHIFHQGDPTGGLHVIARGKAELRRTTEDGVDVVIHIAGAGDSFAEASLFSDTYHCNAIALSNCRVLVFERQAVMERFRADPAFSEALAKRFAGQIQAYRRRIELLAVRDARKRVYLAVAEGLLTDNIKSFASEIGLAHETVYRALTALADQGRIAKTGRGRYQVTAIKGRLSD